MAQDLVLVSAARTTSGDSANLTYPKDRDIRIDINVSARSGTSPTLDIVVQHSPDGGTTWITLATFTQITASGTASQHVRAPHSGLLRVDYTIGGTSPSFTFTATVYRS